MEINKFIKDNERLIKYMVTKMNVPEFLIDDCINEGRLAVYKYYSTTPQPTISLSAFIKFEIIRFLDAYKTTIKRPPKIIYSDETIKPILSINTPINDDLTIEDTLQADEPEDNSLDDEQEAIRKRLSQYLPTLDEQHQKIITMRVIDDMSFEDIGKVLGISKQAISLQFNSQMKKMREYFGSDYQPEKHKKIYKNGRKVGN